MCHSCPYIHTPTSTCRDVFADLKKQQPDKDDKEIRTIISLKWKKLPKLEKAVWPVELFLNVAVELRSVQVVNGLGPASCFSPASLFPGFTVALLPSHSTTTRCTRASTTS